MATSAKPGINRQGDMAAVTSEPFAIPCSNPTTVTRSTISALGHENANATARPTSGMSRRSPPHTPSREWATFYAGMLHPLTAFEFLLPWVALALFAGQQGRKAALLTLAIFPLALVSGAILALIVPPPTWVPAVNLAVKQRDQQGRTQRRSLAGFQGTIQTDAYEVYEAIVKRNPKLQRIGCLAHARRRFYQALKESVREAVWFIGQIRELYRIENTVRPLGQTERHALRQVQAPSTWELMKTRAEGLQPTLLPQSTLGKAVNYFLNEYEP